MLNFPGFQTSRLILKGASLDDVPAYEKYFIDYEVIRHLSAHVPWPYPKGGVLDFFQNFVLPNQGKNRWSWGISKDQFV